MQQPAFFMEFIDNDSYFGNYDLLGKPIVAFLAANDTPEELWPRVEQWLEKEIYDTDKAVLSHFETPFERRVLQLLLERNRPIILFTYNSTSKSSFHELKISPRNPMCLVLRGRPLPNSWQFKSSEPLRMAVVNIADEFVTIGTTSDRDILTILNLHHQSPQKPHREL